MNKNIKMEGQGVIRKTCPTFKFFTIFIHLQMNKILGIEASPYGYIYRYIIYHLVLLFL